MSSLIKSGINYKVSCFVNFKKLQRDNGEEYEIASITPKVQYKDKQSNEYKESKYWSLEEAQAMMACLQRAINHAEERLQPVKKVNSKADDTSNVVYSDNGDDIPF